MRKVGIPLTAHLLTLRNHSCWDTGMIVLSGGWVLALAHFTCVSMVNPEAKQEILVRLSGPMLVQEANINVWP